MIKNTWKLLVAFIISFLVSSNSYASESSSSGGLSAGFDLSLHLLLTERIEYAFTVTWRPLRGFSLFNVRIGYIQGNIKVSGKTKLGYNYSGVFESRLFYLASTLDWAVFRFFFGAGGKFFPLPSTYNFEIERAHGIGFNVLRYQGKT